MICPFLLGRLADAVRAEVARRAAARELSVNEMARHIGVSQPFLCNWLHGRRSIDMLTLGGVMMFLRLAPCEIFRCVECSVRLDPEPVAVPVVSPRLVAIRAARRRPAA